MALGPLMSGIAGFLGSSAGAATLGVASLGLQALQAERLRREAKKNQAKVAPLPSGGLRYTRPQESDGRRGYASTLITGQLGDMRAPQTSAPLVLGKVA